MGLTSITIRRFKRLEDFTLDLEDVNVLIGANNSGKSSVLQAIHFAVAVAQSAKLLGGVAWQQDTYQLSFNPSQLLYSPVADVMTLATGGNLVEDRNKRVEVAFHASDGNSCTVAVRRGRNRNIAVAIEGRQLGEQLQNVQQPFSIYAQDWQACQEKKYTCPLVECEESLPEETPTLYCEMFC